MIGRLLRDLHAARMARTLATMVASRLPLMEGLALTAQTVHNRVLKRASDEIVEAIRGGGSLSSALRPAGVFAPLLVYLPASGESAGQRAEERRVGQACGSTCRLRVARSVFKKYGLI